VESEKDIKAWDNDLKRLNAFEDKEALLLPNRHEFTTKGFCGNLGSIKVNYDKYRFITRIIHTCSKRKSRIEST
jgi:hypothetical protein